MFALLLLYTFFSSIHALIQAKPRKPEHQGGRALLPGRETLLLQPELAEALGDYLLAMIVQKFHEWIEHNRQNEKQSYFKDGRWWTRNDLPAWQRNHFSWVSVSTLQRKMGELEKLGIVQRAQHGRDNGDCTYWYTLNYAEIRRLTLIPIWQEGHSKLESPSYQNGKPSLQNDNTLKGVIQNNPFKEMNLKTTTPITPLHEAGRGIGFDGGVVETQEPVPGEFSPDSTGAHPAIALEPIDAAPEHPAFQVESAGETLPLCPPNSATPPHSALIDEMVNAFAVQKMVFENAVFTHYETREILTPKTAAMWIAVFGEPRVRAVFKHALTIRDTLTNPPGFMLSELRHDRLGLSPCVVETPTEPDIAAPDENTTLDLMPDDLDTEADEPLYRVLARQMAQEGAQP